ncbi:hypothetical protein [Gemmatimonas groenlandica]|uniref:Uncharacterized protein n=1 Tax=Gemmatimonas groenlandica TaxID=2732249 RepID=A0A6M4ITU2_9BACT|nr:hypothetical protein [Gemmatimonas groenlandica]QJR37159.1 hypothetical protein HKW67_17360 [Gemmatimonas groenlandica]
MAKIARSAAVTAGLIVGGAALGGYFGMYLLGILEFFMHPVRGIPQAWQVQWLASVVGAVVGGLVGPLVVWTRLRDVPVWRTVAHTGGGALVGGALAFWGSSWNPILALEGATLGVIAGALVLRLRMRARTDSPHMPPAV